MRFFDAVHAPKRLLHHRCKSAHFNISYQNDHRILKLSESKDREYPKGKKSKRSLPLLEFS